MRATSVEHTAEEALAVEAPEPTPPPKGTKPGAKWFEAAMAAAENNVLPDVLLAGRAASRAALEAHPQLIPHIKSEPWRFTRLNRIWQRAPGEGVGSVDPESWFLKYDEADVVCVVVDGAVAPELSTNLGEGDGFFVASAADAGEFARGLESVPIEIEAEVANPRGALGSAPLAALNAACLTDAVVVEAHKDAVVHVVHVASGRRRHAHVRVQVRAKDAAKLALHQTFVSTTDAPLLCNSRTTIDVDADAQLRHVYCTAYDQGHDVLHFEASTASVKGSYEAIAICLGGTSRLGLDCGIDKPEAHAAVDGLVLAGGRETVDFRTQLRHNQPACTSNQDVRIVAAESGSTVFKGRITVPAIAQETDAGQLCRTFLLSDQAEAVVMPSLEIIADQVRCSHGATVANIDDESLFFLMARGVPEAAARSLLVKAFCDSLVETLPSSTSPYLRQTIDAKISELASKIQEPDAVAPAEDDDEYE